MKRKITHTLTPAEQAIERSLRRGTYISRPISKVEQKRLADIAKNTFAKKKLVSIRISERNHARLKAAAARKGLSYQTYLTSLIHKNVGA